MSPSCVESLDHSGYAAVPSIETGLAFIYGELDRVLRSTDLSTGATILQGCLPLIMHEIPSSTLLKRVGQKRYEQLHTCYQEMSLLNLWYAMELKQVLGVITSVDIPVMVLKGADIATTLYPRPDLRYFGDVDLMVQPKDLAATLAILERLGYSYHQEYRFEAISTQRAGFVYVKAVTAGYLVFEIHTSPHSNELGVSFDVAGIWRRARPITISEVNVCGMGLEDLLIYLCWHCRSHSFERLIWLYDIAILLLRCADQLDWGLLLRLARQQGMMATVYYSIRWCQQLFRTALPQEAQIELYRPPPLVEELIRRFIGRDTIAVLPRSARRARKLLQHFMVDDLRTLCLVELHAIFPSPTHLGRLYMEHSRLPLCLFWLYYFVHPLLALREAFKIILLRIHE